MCSTRSVQKATKANFVESRGETAALEWSDGDETHSMHPAGSSAASSPRKMKGSRVVHPQEYLDVHHVPLYLNDVTTLLLRIRPAAPLDFIASYFSDVINGTHVLLRDFAYVSACPHNRWSFVRVVQESFAGVSPAHHKLSGIDLRSSMDTRPPRQCPIRLLHLPRACLAGVSDPLLPGEESQATGRLATASGA